MMIGEQVYLISKWCLNIADSHKWMGISSQVGFG